MKFRAKYVPHLDEAFPLRSRNPLRYGITAEQMQTLIDEGEWAKFRAEWSRQRYAYRKSNCACMLCGSNRVDNIKILNRYLCEYCAAEIKEIVCRGQKLK